MFPRSRRRADHEARNPSPQASDHFVVDGARPSGQLLGTNDLLTLPTEQYHLIAKNDAGNICHIDKT